MLNETLNEIKEKSLSYWKNGDGNVKVHITKIDYPNDKEYNTLCGIFIDGELIDSYELENITNRGIDEFLNDLDTIRSKNTLFLI